MQRNGNGEKEGEKERKNKRKRTNGVQCARKINKRNCNAAEKEEVLKG